MWPVLAYLWTPSFSASTEDSPPGGTAFAVPPPVRVFGAGDEIVIEYDENCGSALAFVVRTFQHFHYIFEMAPIPPSQRVIPTLTQLLGG
jgi:hypothetical protein